MHVAAKHNPSLLLAYCDGSRKPDTNGDDRSGYGAVFFNCGAPIASFLVGLGRHATVFDPKMHALAHASTKVKRLMDEQTLVQNVTFFSDSVSALLKITDPSAHPSQLPSLLFRDTCFSLLSRFPLLKIMLKWSPGHLGVIGNNLADGLAKRGTGFPPLNSFSYSALKMTSKTETQRRWRDNNPASGTYGTVCQPEVKPTRTFHNTLRELYGRFAQVLVRHGYFGEYYQCFHIDEPHYCRCSCGSSPILESRDHIIFDCPRYMVYRPLLKNRTLQALLDPALGREDFLKFL